MSIYSKHKSFDMLIFMFLVISILNFIRNTSNLTQILGKDHIMVVMPSLTKQYFVQRPTVLTNDDFIFYLHDKYFGDSGECGRLATDDFHTVHRTLNSLMKEPFLSSATGYMAELIGKSEHQLFSFSADPAKQLHWERLGRAVPAGDHVEIDLFALTMNYIGDIAGEVLMGKAFFENNPNVLDDLWVFDDGFNALLSGAPPVTPKISRARAARARLNAVFVEWNEALSKTLKGEDPGHQWRDMSDVSETMRMRTKALEGIGSSDAHNSATNLGVYWAMMVNANKVTFWLLLHIISNPSLLSRIRAEIASFATTVMDQKSLPRLALDAENLAKSCPTFKAAFYEAMRLYTAGTAYKKVLQPVTLTESAADAAVFGKPRPQTYRVPAASYLVVPGAAMQTDARLWADPERFDPGRFLVPDEEGGKGGMRVDVRHLNAFGGGHTVCKGRAFAEREVLLFVAGFLAVWDFGPVKGGEWRIPGKWYNGTGSANPAVPVRVRVGRRV